jgi:hypothetical protein
MFRSKPREGATRIEILISPLGAVSIHAPAEGRRIGVALGFMCAPFRSTLQDREQDWGSVCNIVQIRRLICPCPEAAFLGSDQFQDLHTLGQAGAVDVDPVVAEASGRRQVIETRIPRQADLFAGHPAHRHPVEQRMGLGIAQR